MGPKDRYGIMRYNCITITPIYIAGDGAHAHLVRSENPEDFFGGGAPGFSFDGGTLVASIKKVYVSQRRKMANSGGSVKIVPLKKNYEDDGICLIFFLTFFLEVGLSDVYVVSN